MYGNIHITHIHVCTQRGGGGEIGEGGGIFYLTSVVPRLSPIIE